MSVPLQYSIHGRRSSEVTRSIEDAIRDGRLPPGAALPPVRALARQLGVAPATVAAAYRALASRGLASGQGRRGTHVSPRPPLMVPGPPPIAPHLRNVADGNPDPARLPRLQPVLARCAAKPRLYSEARNREDLLAAARAQFATDAIPADAIAVVGGALDGIERVLQAHLRPGDRIAIEDPGYTGVLDLVGALGLHVEPVAIDDFGPLPESLAAALAAGARAMVLTPRAQNPMGSALDEKRVRALRPLVDAHPNVLFVEDDHAGPVAGVPALTLSNARRAHWAVVRSVCKSLGPDLRLALLAGDATTIARVEGRQHIGTGWVSHVLQELVTRLWADRATQAGLRTAAARYTRGRETLIQALAVHGLPARGRSGLNVWVNVPDEHAAVTGLAAAGWAVRPGDRYRLKAPPAIRITTSTMSVEEARDVARALAGLLAPGRATRST
jgi:DNA-binding transcriptional MocR family regulator